MRSLHWTPDVDARSVELTVRVRSDGQARLRLRVVLRARGEVLADDSYAVERSEVRRRITVGDGDMSLGHSDLLWAPEAPNLIEASLTLLDEEGRVLDEVGSYTALRGISATRDRL
ncbi:MAG TPA: hypothetical protein VIH08_11985, partial [Blastococcus sp.]